MHPTLLQKALIYQQEEIAAMLLTKKQAETLMIGTRHQADSPIAYGIKEGFLSIVKLIYDKTEQCTLHLADFKLLTQLIIENKQHQTLHYLMCQNLTKFESIAGLTIPANLSSIGKQHFLVNLNKAQHLEQYAEVVSQSAYILNKNTRNPTKIIESYNQLINELKLDASIVLNEFKLQ